MKKAKLLFIVLASVCLFCGCMGDHSTSQGKDTDKSMYGTIAKDTSKGDSTGADTASMDNSGSGGTKIPKADTVKKK
jgi:hypothetical protein